MGVIYATLTGRDPTAADLGLDPSSVWTLDAATAVVLDDPFGPFPFPFVQAWPGEDGDAVVLDFDGAVRPSVRLATARSAPRVEVLDARLFLEEGAALETSDLILEGELHVRAGATLTVHRVEGDLHLEAGTLLGGARVSGDVTLDTAASLVLRPGESLIAEGTVDVAGPILVQGPLPAGDHLLIASSQLHLDGQLAVPTNAVVVTTDREVHVRVAAELVPAEGAVDATVSEHVEPGPEPMAPRGCATAPAAVPMAGVFARRRR